MPTLLTVPSLQRLFQGLEVIGHGGGAERNGEPSSDAMKTFSSEAPWVGAFAIVVMGKRCLTPLV
jgi:hypothetical protein